MLLLFFQENFVRRAAVVAQAELFPLVEPVLLFAQGFVETVVKVQTGDQLLSVLIGVRVRLHHRLQELGERQKFE